MGPSIMLMDPHQSPFLKKDSTLNLLHKCNVGNNLHHEGCSKHIIHLMLESYKILMLDLIKSIYFIKSKIYKKKTTPDKEKNIHQYQNKPFFPLFFPYQPILPLLFHSLFSHTFSDSSLIVNHTLFQTQSLFFSSENCILKNSCMKENCFSTQIGDSDLDDE